MHFGQTKKKKSTVEGQQSNKKRNASRPNCAYAENDFPRQKSIHSFSIVTFCVSMLMVVVWRIITHLCFQPRDREVISQVDVELAAGFKSNSLPGGIVVSPLAVGAKTAEMKAKEEQVQIGWMTEAKDWAGELISGQSMV